MSIENLPRLGLGLSSNLDASDEPHPYRLLDQAPGLFDFVEYSAPLSLEQARREASLFPELFERREKVPALFHPVHLNLFGPELEPPDRLAELDAHARAVGSPWVGNDVGWWHARGEPFPGYLYLAPPLDARGLENAVAHALHVQAHLSVPLVLENPAVIAVRGGWHVLDFMARLHARTKAPLLVDLGHLWSYQLARGLPPNAGFDGFPFDQVAELHIAGGVVGRAGERRFYVDDHTQPVREELFELLAEMLPRCSNLRALTFEGDGHPADVARITLERLRPLIRADPAKREVPPSDARAPSSPGGEALGAPEAELAIALFKESYGLCPSEEDPSGTGAELDFRLAVLAQQLDRAFRVTRLLMAPDRQALLEFTQSAPFRACFVDSERTLFKAFEAFAIDRLRARGDVELEAAVAIEALLSRGAGALSASRQKALSAVLREARFAAQALRRHLCGRAWVTGHLEHEALEAVRQALRRSLRGQALSGLASPALRR
ncbi:MAG: DUF692 family protein [Myxococcaceae bacterium]|nr:DUF692 family protein [Myxococcaceae bacterium]